MGIFKYLLFFFCAMAWYYLLGLITLFFSMIVQVIIPPIPAELLVISAGKIYGVLLATLVGGTGLFIGSVVAYYIGFYLHGRFSRFFEKKKVKHIMHRLQHYETAILWIRVLPNNPSDIICYAAGMMQFHKKKFLPITFITSYIRCFLLAYLGASLHGLQSFFAIVGILILSGIVTYVVVYKKKK